MQTIAGVSHRQLAEWANHPSFFFSHASTKKAGIIYILMIKGSTHIIPLSSKSNRFSSDSQVISSGRLLFHAI